MGKGRMEYKNQSLETLGFLKMPSFTSLHKNVIRNYPQLDITRILWGLYVKLLCSYAG